MWDFVVVCAGYFFMLTVALAALFALCAVINEHIHEWRLRRSITAEIALDQWLRRKDALQLSEFSDEAAEVDYLESLLT
jgi:hypothetical protein